MLLLHVAMNISDRARLYREIRRVLKRGGKFATFDVVLNSSDPHYPVPWARTPTTSFLLTATATREAIEADGFHALAWQDDSEAAKAWVTQLRASGPPPSPNLSVVMGPAAGSRPGNPRVADVTVESCRERLVASTNRLDRPVRLFEFNVENLYLHPRGLAYDRPLRQQDQTAIERRHDDPRENLMSPGVLRDRRPHSVDRSVIGAAL